MIYTVTLNPSVDYIVRLDELVCGITNRAKGEEYYFGGKGINVSRVLAELGYESTALGFVAGFTGKEIEAGVRSENILTDFVRLRDGISRINIKIIAENETEINAKGPRVEAAELDELFRKINRIKDGDTLVLAGSVPDGISDDVYEKILKSLCRRNVRTVVDATKDLLLNTLKYNPFLIKPNRQELSELFGVEINSDESVEKYARELQSLGAKNVLVSLGGEGAMLIDEFGEMHRAGVVKGKTISTVGSGDSMLAGLIAGFEREKSYARALRLATACGNATAFSEGLASKEKIEKMMKLFDLTF